MNKLCCIVNPFAGCAYCDFITCKECSAAGEDNHTISDLQGEEWWMCAPTQKALERMDPTVLREAFYEGHPVNVMRDNVKEINHVMRK